MVMLDPELEESVLAEVDRRSSGYVRWLQQSLNKVGGARLTADGRMGARTRSVVRNFQAQRGLTADGVAGPRTEAALVALGAPPPPSTGAPAGGGPHPRVNTLLPPGPGLYSYKPVAHQFGLPETIAALQRIGGAWNGRHPGGPRVGIGDISRRGGGPFAGHRSHQRGVDVDIRLMRKDGKEAGVNYQSPEYSRLLTQELVDLIRGNGRLRVQFIFFNDGTVRGVRHWPNHDDHLHVRFFTPTTGTP
jgi:Putative peptidoglycan binding domain/Penicillin-insensitive murein endopeptidase